MHKFAVLTAGVAIVMAAPVLAQAAAPAAPAAHYTTAETTIGTLLADPAAKAVLDKNIPGLSDNPSIGMASAMTLRAIQPMAADKMSEETLNKVDADLAKLPVK